MNLDDLKDLAGQRVPLWTWIVPIVLCAMILQTCSSGDQLRSVPESFQGKWEADNTSSLLFVLLRNSSVTLVYEHAKYRCAAKSILMERYWVSDIHEVSIDCDVAKLPAKYRECADRLGTQEWTIIFTAKSGSEFTQLKGFELSHPCLYESRSMPLLFRR